MRNGKIVKIPLKSAAEKLENTLKSVGWPMIQAGASTIMCILPLLFLQVGVGHFYLSFHFMKMEN